jgi:hypothetical protein
VDEATLAVRADEAHADGYLCRSGELWRSFGAV